MMLHGFGSKLLGHLHTIHLRVEAVAGDEKDIFVFEAGRAKFLNHVPDHGIGGRGPGEIVEGNGGGLLAGGDLLQTFRPDGIVDCIAYLLLRERVRVHTLHVASRELPAARKLKLLGIVPEPFMRPEIQDIVIQNRFAASARNRGSSCKCA